MKRTTVSERALVLAPRGRDAVIAVTMLGEAGITAEPCASLSALLYEINQGAAAVVVTEEALKTADLAPLAAWIAEQEEWSDLPFVLLTSHGGGIERNPTARRYLSILGNATFIERPFHPTTLISLVQSALRGRRRQYEARARLEALRESETRFRNMADHAPVMTWVTDASGHCNYLNRPWYEFTGQTAAQAEAFGWLDAVHPDDKDWSAETFLAANRKREAFRLEYRLRRADGAYRWSIDAATPRFGTDGEFLGYIGSVIDIDERREMEERLRNSEARYRTLFNSIEAGFCVVEVNLKDHAGRIDYRVVEANPAFYRHSGFAEEVLGRWLREAAPALEEHWYETYGRVARTGEPVRFEQGSNMLERWFDVYAFRTGEPSERRVAILFNDISARRNAEEKLRELNETLELRVAEALAERRLLADVIDGADIFVQVADKDYTWLAINDAAASEFSRIFGVDRPKAGGNMLALLKDQPHHQAAVKAIWSRALAGEEFVEVDEFGDPSLDRRCYEMRFRTLRDAEGRSVGAYQFVSDVTERLREQARLKEAEEALRQAQKMEAVGQLTGGVAHDFNNLLTIIKSSTELLRRPGIAEERRARYVEAISDTVDRASKLTGQLLAFARRQSLKPEVFNVAQRIQAITEMLATIVGSRIQIVTDVSDAPCFVKADASQFETALVNMAVNARDAMNGEGTLTLNVHQAPYVPAIRSHDAKRGDFVCVAVSDTGSGIPADKVPQIFEPFFTTKAVGKGTGLGLSQVYGFTKQSGGDVLVQSTVGKGTTFTLYLPRVEEVAEHGHAEHQEASAEPAAVPDRPRVLVVEDNVEVGTFSTQLLQDLGYETTWAANADEALKLIGEIDGFDVVFSDVIMPGMSGIELGREIQRRYPGLPVVLTSGYSHVLAEEGRRGFELLQKPYAADELSRVLGRVARIPQNRSPRGLPR